MTRSTRRTMIDDHHAAGETAETVAVEAGGPDAAPRVPARV